MSVLRKTARRSAVRTRMGRTAKVTAIAAAGIALALGTTACGAGQISQTASQEPAVNGNLANVGSMQLRNVQIMYPTDKADEVFGNGGPFEISFVISNVDPVLNDRLVGIDAPDGGKVTIVGDTSIAAGQALRAGKPVGLLEPENVQSTDEEKRLTVTLSGAGDSVASGLTTPLKFRFEKSGEATVDTPVDSGATLPRQDKIRQAEAPAVEH
ncbi:hypothetical protein G3I13_23440 [Streptomyces sp. SID6673]|nr:hypothetical protein [Streptomyces sp. SID11726]NEB27300.1 hypothetical protein [Streptomyces sp. SID6673]